MKIKRFEAAGFREALALVKKELGEEAVILSSEEIPGRSPRVEVLAALDPDGAADAKGFRMEGLERGEPPEPKDRVSLSETLCRYRKTGEDLSLRTLVEEVKRLREDLDHLKGRGYRLRLPENKQRLYDALKEQAIQEDLALELSEQAERPQDLVPLLARDIRGGWNWSERKIVLLIGPTGVGKTTTAAKLCGQAVKRRKKAGLISLDTFRIGAIEQIRIYANLLGVPLVIASSVEEVRRGIERMPDRDLIFIDTTGRNPRDPAYLRDLQAVFALGIPLETHLLIGGNLSASFMAEAWSHYRELPVDRIGFTKMDEAGGFGPLYNFLRLARMPVAYVTHGQQVPNDIAFYSGEELAERILNRETIQVVPAESTMH
jgi:flagellar biosynthesis protein FlhF